MFPYPSDEILLMVILLLESNSEVYYIRLGLHVGSKQIACRNTSVWSHTTLIVSLIDKESKIRKQILRVEKDKLVTHMVCRAKLTGLPREYQLAGCYIRPLHGNRTVPL